MAQKSAASGIVVPMSAHRSKTDRQGNPVTGGTAEAIALFDAAIDALNVYTGDPVALADAAIEAAPDFALAHILKAYLFALATEPEATVEAKAIAAHARTLPLGDREAALLGALDRLLAGNWTQAAVALDRHGALYPRDLLGLQAGHLMDFYRANARDLRDRIARALPHWSADMPGYGIVLGMYAFGLEESGDYARAEATDREAVSRDPRDCWAHHAVAHLMEMQGRSQDGIGWMRAREAHWSGPDNFFRVHNWWHLALYHMDLEDTEAALALYDGPIRADKSGVVLDLVDASALLWRLHMTGTDVGDRWTELAEAWDAHADGGSYPFNDWHAVMAYLGAGRDKEVDRILKGFGKAAGAETAEWSKRTGKPLVEGFTAFFRGDYGTAVETLHGARYIANGFGGSNAQRDIIDWTLTEAAVRSGETAIAEAFANERLAAKPFSPMNRAFRARIAV
jgi:tetratricopeptide (TPR) repeat protein